MILPHFTTTSQNFIDHFLNSWDKWTHYSSIHGGINIYQLTCSLQNIFLTNNASRVPYPPQSDILGTESVFDDEAADQSSMHVFAENDVNCHQYW